MTTKKQIKDALRAQADREGMDLRVLVVGGGFQYAKMFYDAGIKGATCVDDADIICFTGGEDVDPALYGEKPIPGTNFNPARDEREGMIFAEAALLKKPMVGICRGGQFLNVMNKGRMWQDVDGHAIRDTHDVTDMRTGKVVKGMTSTHHQMMIPGKDAEIIALASLSTRKESAGEAVKRVDPELDDYEVLWYPDTLSLCFQPHPEFGEGDCRDYFLGLLDDYVVSAA